MELPRPVYHGTCCKTQMVGRARIQMQWETLTDLNNLVEEF